MKSIHRQLVIFSCILLLQLGVFVSTVHAAEHPFHAHNELCASFINFGHHDVTVDAAQLAVAPLSFSVVRLVVSNTSRIFTSTPVYLSRAPPSFSF